MFILLVAVGFITGILAGLLGIGGGVIAVPALYYIFSHYGIPTNTIMHMAVATALTATTVTSIGSTLGHHLKKAILIPLLKTTTPALMVGCIAGVILNRILPNEWIRMVFGFMAVLLGIYFSIPKLPPLQIAPHPNRSIIFFSFWVGTFSSLLGIGGGIFMVPLFLGYQIHMKNAVATSSASTLVTAAFGSLLYFFVGWGQQIPETIGYVHIPAFLLIGIGSLATTLIGVKLAHILPVNMIKHIFGLALCLTGFVMIING